MSPSVTALTPIDLETHLAALGHPVARLIAAAGIARSTWRDWRAGRTTPRPDKWASAVAAFNTLAARDAETAPAPAAPGPEAPAAELVTLTGSSVPTGAPVNFTPIATAAPAVDLVASCERARSLIDRSRDSLVQFSAVVGDDSRERREMDRADELRDAAVADLAARPAATPRDLAAKASVVLAGLGERPGGWVHEVPDYIDLVRSLAVDAVGLGTTPAVEADEAVIMAADRVAALAEQDEATLLRLVRLQERLVEGGATKRSDCAWAAAERLHGRVLRRLRRSCRAVAAMPATSAAGVAAKARATRAVHSSGDEEKWFAALRDSVVRDAAQLAVAPVRRVSLDASLDSFAADLSTFAGLIAESDRLARLASECEERTIFPEVPETLFCRPLDGLFILAMAARWHDGRSWYNVSSVERLRTEPFEGDFVDPSGRDRRRRDEIVAAYDGWEADHAAAREASGLAAIAAEQEAYAVLMRQMRDVMLDRPARTLDEVLSKAAMFAWWVVDEDERPAPAMVADRARMLAKGEGTKPLAMALGVLADLVTMGEARGLTLMSSLESAHVGAVEAPVAQAAA